MSVYVRELERGQGLVWRDLRLRALAESPDAFAVTYDDDARLSDESWHRMIDATVDDAASTSLVTEAGGTPVGMAFCRLAESDGRLGQLFAMWVDPQFRRQGAGRALIDFALSWMRDLGATTAELTVTETNQAAVHLYASSGFVDTGNREPLREGSHLRVVKMRRELR